MPSKCLTNVSPSFSISGSRCHRNVEPPPEKVGDTVAGLVGPQVIEFLAQHVGFEQADWPHTNTDPKTGTEIWLLPMSGDTTAAKPIPLSQTTVDESQGSSRRTGSGSRTRRTMAARHSCCTSARSTAVRAFPKRNGKSRCRARTAASRAGEPTARSCSTWNLACRA